MFDTKQLHLKTLVSKVLMAGVIALTCVGTLSAQNQRTITGRVSDNSNNPLVGALVVEQGTSSLSVVDAQGNYSIGVSSDNAQLTISLVGYESQTVATAGRSVVNVILAGDAQQIEDVVVIGYGTQKRANLTSAIGTASGEVLENRPIATIGEGLQGVIPNLQINPGGTAPGQGASFNIRGYTSINGGEPLVLVDGVVQDPNLVNPNDIESVSVLKDAASAAIYGARAAYGVVLFTTKSGRKNQKPTFNAQGSWSVSTPINLQHTMNSLDFMSLINEAYDNAGGNPYFTQTQIDAVKKYMADPRPENAVFYPSPANDGRFGYSGNTDWAKELYKNGSQQQYNISMSGGSETSRYYMSYGFLDVNGVLTAYNDKYQRHTFNVDVSTDIKEWLNFGAKVKYTYGYEDHPSGGMSNSGLNATSGMVKGDLQPMMPIRHPDGSFAGQGNYTNPFAVAALGGSEYRKTNDLWLTGKLTVRPLRGWNINADFTFNPYSYNHDRTVKQFMERRGDGSEMVYPWVRDNSISRQNRNNYYTALNVYSDFTRSAGNHNFKLTVGYNQEVKTLKRFTATRLGMIDAENPNLSMATGAQTVQDNTLSSWAVQGVFGRLHYDYKEKYLVDINARYDGSSKFPDGQRFAFFPSVAAAWYISHEGFMEGVSHWFSDLKLRGSYGSLGNQNVRGNFPYVPSYNITADQGYLLGGERGVAITAPGLVSASLTWEKVNQFNVGVDFGFFTNRLTGSFDIYQRKTIGMLAPMQPMPGTLGAGVPTSNSADLKTSGWEVNIKWADRIESAGLDYHVSFVLSDAMAKITKYTNPTGTLANVYDPGFNDEGSQNFYSGKTMGEIWGFASNGLFQSAAEIESAPSQSELYGGGQSPGDVRYVDRDGDGKISRGKNTIDDHGDRFIIGNSTPRYQYGISLGAAWKGIDLAIFLQGVAKRDMWDGSARYFGTGNEWDVPARDIADWWSEDNPDAWLPRPYMETGGGTQTRGNREASTRYLQNAAYLRLKQLSLGYTLPQDLTRRISLDKVRIYFTGQNLLTFTKLSKLYDPEFVGMSGRSGGSVAGNMTYPIAKTFSFGVNLSF